MKFLFIILSCCVSLAMAQNPAPPGAWIPYVSHKYCVDVELRDGKTNVITQGGFYIYDDATGESVTYTTTDGLSNTNPTALLYDEETDLMFLGFGDGMINYFNDIDEGIRYISDIERSELFTTKTINQFSAKNKMLYIATVFGVVIYDIDARETRSSATKIGDNVTGAEVVDVEVMENQVWAAMGTNGLWYAEVDHPNLADPGAWQKETVEFGLPEGNTPSLAAVGEVLYAIVDSLVYQKIGEADWTPAPFEPRNYEYLKSNDDRIVAVSETDAEILYPDGSSWFIDAYSTITCIIPSGKIAWMGDDVNGMHKVNEWAFKKVGPEGPSDNLVREIIAGDGEFYVAPSPRNGSTGASFCAECRSGVYYYSRETGWKVISLRSRALEEHMWLGFTNGYYDPFSRTAYLGSTIQGLLELRDGDTLRSWTDQNTEIVSASLSDLDDLRVTGITKDSRGNLWVVTVLADASRVLNLKTPDDVWYNYSLPTGTHPADITMDYYDNKWILDQGGGVIVFNENGTLDDTSDDLMRKLSSNPGNGALQSNSVSSVVRDLEGQMWIGTVDGISVFFDPYDIFGDGFIDASCPVFENQCLMKGQRVNTMAVDGANRKWIGTENGVFLMSEDGTEQVYHFTKENSQLLSNKILSIAIDPGSGEVFFGTEAGLISFMGDAVQGEVNSDSVYAFPNPVFADYEGVITIRGTVQDARVKITTPDGKLVREIEALGGQAVWDREDMWGNKVRSGIYLALIADREGKGAGITKIALIDR